MAAAARPSAAPAAVDVEVSVDGDESIQRPYPLGSPRSGLT